MSSWGCDGYWVWDQLEENHFNRDYDCLSSENGAWKHIPRETGLLCPGPLFRNSSMTEQGTKSRHIWEERISTEKMSLEEWPAGKSARAFSWLMIILEGPAHHGWCYLWALGPGVYKKASWASHDEQTNIQHSSMASASVPACRFLPQLPSVKF